MKTDVVVIDPSGALVVVLAVITTIGACLGLAKRSAALRLTGCAAGFAGAAALFSWYLWAGNVTWAVLDGMLAAVMLLRTMSAARKA